MARTPDRRDGPLYEDDYIIFGTESLYPTTPLQDGVMTYVTNSGFRYVEKGYVKRFSPLSNFTASLAPSTSDNLSKGYELGSIWVVSASLDAYMLVSASNAAAQWKNITSGSSATGSVNPEDHKTYRHLIHFINGGGPGDGFATNPFQEVIGTAFPSRITWWTNANKTLKIFQTEITRSGIFPITQSYKIYDTDGVTLLKTATDIIYYNGAFETFRSRSFA